ncbi:MAG: transposase, partial [Bacteroidetes bacterium]|nr:transposase [Bacteroidota bacterium]
STKGNAQSFKKHIKKVLYEYRNNSKIIMVLDNVRYHHCKYIKGYTKFTPLKI